MIIDYTYFSYGCGLVMVGFLSGVFINVVISAMRGIR